MSKKNKGYKRKVENNKISFWKNPALISIFPAILTLIVSIYTGIQANNLQKKMFEFDKMNSYPAFEFTVSKDTDNKAASVYTIKKKKGEMNNVNFSVFEEISGNGTYNGRPMYINQSILFRKKANLNKLQASYPYDFNSEEIRMKMNYLLNKKSINANVTSLYIQRFYDVAYMNFKHEFKHEYYQVGNNGIGLSVTSPYPNYDNLSGLQVFGSFINKFSEKLNNQWLAEKMVLQIENSFRYDN